MKGKMTFTRAKKWLRAVDVELTRGGRVWPFKYVATTYGEYKGQLSSDDLEDVTEGGLAMVMNDPDVGENSRAYRAAGARLAALNRIRNRIIRGRVGEMLRRNPAAVDDLIAYFEERGRTPQPHRHTTARRHS